MQNNILPGQDENDGQIYDKKPNINNIKADNASFVSESPSNLFSHISSESSKSHESLVNSPNDLLLGDIIGRGGSGVVYRGFYSGQLVAVKVLDVSSADASILTEIEQEITSLKKLKHPRIVQYRGVLCQWTPRQTVSLLLEFMSCGSIASMLKDFGPFPVDLVRKYTAQLLEGLTFLHDRGIVHRDIKGANILVDFKGDSKLSDFGSAHQQLTSSLTAGEFHEKVRGSIYWMDPEILFNTQLVNEDGVVESDSRNQQHSYKRGRRSDVWSVGCTVLEMVTGQIPWSNLENADSITALRTIAQSDAIPPIPMGLPDDLNHFLRLCLNRNYNERPNCRELLSHSFVKKYFQLYPPIL